MSPNNIATVELENPNPNWIKRFEDARDELEPIIGKHVVAIEHVGSTSIPNLLAKPEIDILVGLNRLEDAENFIEPLKIKGYLYYKRFEEFVPNRRYFRKSEGITPLVHIHMYEVASEEYKNHLLFRDYMSKHPEAIKGYEDLKRNLLESSGRDRGIYQEGKIAFIKNIIAKAQE